MDMTIRELTARAEEVLRQTGLTERYIVALKRTWRAFEEQSEDPAVVYTPDMGARFLRERHGIDPGGARLRAGEQRRRRAIRVLDNTQRYGAYVALEDHGFDTKFCSRFEAPLAACLVELKKTRGDATMRMYTTTLNQMSAFFDQRGVGSLGDLTGGLVVAFVESLAAKRQQPTVYGGAARARTILAVLHRVGVTRGDLSQAVPKVKVPAKKVPPVYTPEEINAMLGAVNTASPTGRRDLAVCLLAARLGMRASDICALTFANLRWAANTIEFTTVKTGRAAVLPLTNEIGEAIIAYLKDGRPECGEPYVFLRTQKPFTKLSFRSLHGIVTGYLRKANIAADGRRRGPRALRSSLASRMLEAGAALPVISEALAHSNSDTTRIYLKIGIEQLRRCALNVTTPAGVWGWGR